MIAVSHGLWQCGNFFDGGNKAITVSRQGLNEARTPPGIAQGFAQAHHGVIHSVIKINERFAGPETFAKLITGDYLAGFFQKYRENLKGLLGQLQTQAVLAYFKRLEIDLKNAAANHPGRSRTLLLHIY